MKKHLYILIVSLFAFNATAQIQVGPVEPYSICQTPYTGIATFDLQEYKAQVLGSLDPTLYSVNYYFLDPRLVAPGTANPALPALFTNTVNPLTVFARVSENANPNNFATTIVNLFVEPQSTALPAEYSSCDTDAVNDGFMVINLTSLSPAIIGSQVPASNFNVRYFFNEADALNNENAIVNADEFYASSETLWARVSNDQFPNGCPAIAPITISISQLPQPIIISLDGSFTSCVDYSNPTIIYRAVNLFSGYDNTHTFIWYKDGEVIENAILPNYYAYESGDYTVMVISPNPLNCVSAISPVFHVNKSGPASIIGNGYSIDENSIIVNAEGFGTYQYSLDTNGPWQDSNIFMNPPQGNLTIYIRDITDPLNNCDIVTIENVLSTPATKMQSLTHYPNPVASTLHLKNDTAIDAVKIHNAFGQLIVTKTFNDTEAKLDMSGFTKGVYFVNVNSNNAFKTLKIVKE
ncbi:T9SS type A sorting domain-containing protein [Flavobacterium sp. Sd200]|uniref:T9SS type A sorting domain-containing protein n=1 Tax=Flavobacterium sp. Sd200 TaxID=2692211 RepID=UPI00136AFBCB|nr:T9SS type A sorting domain-containing protein [Flavobacterium sp. Sd200]MXN91504.1 T9SS type A sorting domain-containing protein [Flavobacterium sp. Sd200]